MKQSYLLTSSLFLLFACAACEEDDKMMSRTDMRCQQGLQRFS